MLQVKAFVGGCAPEVGCVRKVADGGGGKRAPRAPGHFAVGLDAQLGKLLLHFAFAFQEELRLH